VTSPSVHRIFSLLHASKVRQLRPTCNVRDPVHFDRLCRLCVSFDSGRWSELQREMRREESGGAGQYNLLKRKRA
jgi:hypothetical protein